MTTFIKMQLKNSYDQTNIDKYRVAANNKGFHIKLKLIFLRIINRKFEKTRQLVCINKNVCKNDKNQHV